MKLKDKKAAYHNFFTESEAGKHFVTTVEAIVDRKHTEAEKNPELARDYVQQAKGAREVLEHIKSILM